MHSFIGIQLSNIRAKLAIFLIHFHAVHLFTAIHLPVKAQTAKNTLQ